MRIRKHLHRAIVRKPSPSLSAALTTANLGPPDYLRAVAQHEAYCKALERCGLELTKLEPDDLHPDSTFVEDTAVLVDGSAVLTRPGAPSRAGEVASVAEVLTQALGKLHKIEEPGTLDGGDVCEAGSHYFIGISERTNEAGARQLGRFLVALGHGYSLIDIRGISGLLHLKSGLASLGDKRLVVIDALSARKEFADYELVRVPEGEEYAANCIRINDRVLIADGYAGFAAILAALGYQTILLNTTEFQKVDGGLSCLSLRF